MCIPQGVDKLAGLQATHLCHHHGEQGIGGDVEWHPEEAVGAALVELEAEASVGYIELEQAVAGRESHIGEVGDVPGADDDTARVGIVTYIVDRCGELVDDTTARVAPRAPLSAVARSEVAVLVSPLVQDAYTIMLKVLNIGVALYKPQ